MIQYGLAARGLFVHIHLAFFDWEYLPFTAHMCVLLLVLLGLPFSYAPARLGLWQSVGASDWQLTDTFAEPVTGS